MHDDLVLIFDRALRTLSGLATTSRPDSRGGLPEARLARASAATPPA